MILCSFMCLIYSEVCTSYTYNSPSCSSTRHDMCHHQILDSFSYTSKCSVHEESCTQDCRAAHHKLSMNSSGYVRCVGMVTEGENSAEGIFFSNWMWTAGMFEKHHKSNSKGAILNRKHLGKKIK